MLVLRSRAGHPETDGPGPTEGWSQAFMLHCPQRPLTCRILIYRPMEQRLILINLLIKLGVAAAVSSALVRSLEFKSLLFRDERSLKHRIYLVLWIGIPLTLGVWIRFGATS